ncbi:MAG: hypothetical protein WBA51_08695 [Erythrobacter sp.]
MYAPIADERAAKLFKTGSELNKILELYTFLAVSPLTLCIPQDSKHSVKETGVDVFGLCDIRLSSNSFAVFGDPVAPLQSNLSVRALPQETVLNVSNPQALVNEVLGVGYLW